ncbi:MAG: hypothetical protein Q9169_005581 [Polycauliona sp. 2 TL-2023]
MLAAYVRHQAIYASTAAYLPDASHVADLSLAGNDCPYRRLLAAGSPVVKRSVKVSETNGQGNAKKPKVEHNLRYTNRKNLLCEHCSSFSEASNGSFEESGGSMELLKDDVHAFDCLIQWCYGKDFRSNLSPIGNIRLTTKRYVQLVRFYVLADKVCIPLLKNHVMNLLLETSTYPDNTSSKSAPDDDEHRGVSIPVAGLAYSYTLKGSPLRKFMAAFFAWRHSSLAFENEKLWDRLSDEPELTRDVVINLGKRLNLRKNPFPDTDNNFLEPENT